MLYNQNYPKKPRTNSDPTLQYSKIVVDCCCRRATFVFTSLLILLRLAWAGALLSLQAMLAFVVYLLSDVSVSNYEVDTILMANVDAVDPLSSLLLSL